MLPLAYIGGAELLIVGVIFLPILVVIAIVKMATKSGKPKG